MNGPSGGGGSVWVRNNALLTVPIQYPGFRVRPLPQGVCMAMVRHEAGFPVRPEDGLGTGVVFPVPTGRRARPWTREGMRRVAEKWSARKTLVFIIVVCGGFWAAVIAYLLT